MSRFLLQRLLFLIPTLLGVLIVTCDSSVTPVKLMSTPLSASGSEVAALAKALAPAPVPAPAPAPAFAPF